MNEERKAEGRKFVALIRAIAKALGGEVTKEPDGDDSHWFYCQLTTGAGLPLSLHYRAHEKKITVSVSLPSIKGRDSASHQSPREVITHEEQKTGTAPVYEIGVSPDKTAERIAWDITRRLIPGATILYTRACDRRDQCEKYARDTEATIAQLAKTLNVEPRGVRLYCGGCTLEVSGPDSVRFDHLYVSASLGAKIAALVLAEKGAE
jgi:hypothetical protein